MAARNGLWAALLVGAATIGIGGVVVASIRRRPNPRPDDPPPPAVEDPPTVEGPLARNERVARESIEFAMPSHKRFRMGWTLIDHEVSASDDGFFAYRVLELLEPSDDCAPDPCRYVAVYAAEYPGGGSRSGFIPSPDRAGAYATLNDKRARG